jgi:FKBP-type peptidyl-prolyl cis-trans isomerase
MMQKNVRRFVLLGLVLAAVMSMGFVRASAQGPAGQGPAAQPAAAPGAPPAPEDVAAIPADAEKSASGLAWKVLKPGTGRTHPASTDKVKVSYNGWTSNGRIFDSTDMRKKPSEFMVGNVLPGMSEGIQLMTVGEKRRFWMPADLAFKNAPGKPQGMCVFEIELLDVQPGAPAAAAPQGAYPAPPDVAAPPADAQKTKSGLASKVIKPGTGKAHPSSTSTVTVHYILWTPDGKMVETSRVGDPATFPLDRVIKGWTEGVQLMVEGETRRFWIPGNLAYGDKPTRPGAPAGMLVFDVELIKIQ